MYLRFKISDDLIFVHVGFATIMRFALLIIKYIFLFSTTTKQEQKLKEMKERNEYYLKLQEDVVNIKSK